MKLKSRNKGKAVKNQFVLSVGDEGAVFAHYAEGRLANKLFIDSPFSPDVKLIERLTGAYPKSPIYMLVDVIEQNYTQQVLPPVSSFNIKQQIKRRIKRDFQPNDLNNVLPLGRSKEGRRDWNFLFISLANSDPFAKWLDIVLSQKNDFGGVYLLPVEATRLLHDMNKVTINEEKTDWELLVLHNKTGGFRIVAFKNGQILFTRLAQNLIGDNIAEITVGNMEQEISNTVEYLKRLAFKGEADSKITIVAGADILQKVTPKSLKFGKVELLTPYQLSEKLQLPEAVSDKDKYSDILTSTHFAVSKKHVLKFNSNFTRKIENVYKAIRGVYVFAVILAIGLIAYAAYEAYQTTVMAEQLETSQIRQKQAEGRLKDVESKKADLPTDVDKQIEIMSIAKMFRTDQYESIRLLSTIAPIFNDSFVLDRINYTDSSEKENYKFTMTLSLKIYVSAAEQDKFNEKTATFLAKIQEKFPDYLVAYVSQPTITQTSELEDIKGTIDAQRSEVYTVPAEIRITGGGVK